MKKKKRRAKDGTDGRDGSGDIIQEGGNTATVEKEKRTKTGRACDACVSFITTIRGRILTKMIRERKRLDVISYLD